MKPKLLIFDFDGTIVDSKSVYYCAINKFLSEHGLAKKQIDKAVDMGLSITETLKNLGFSFANRILIKRKIMKAVMKKFSQVKKCKDADSVKNLNIKKVLVSNSLSEFILPVIKNLKLRKYFSGVYGAENFTLKENFIKSYLRKNKLKPQEVIYIGDRVKDVDVARKVGCTSVIISNKCSWDSRKDILKEKPDFIINDLRELKKII